MSNLFVIGFDEPHKAEELRLKLQELQGKYVLDLQEMVVVAKDEKGKVKLHQSGGVRTLESPVIPGVCGSLTALICLSAAGSTLAALGITHHFMKKLVRILLPGGSALFVLSGRPSPDREEVFKELSGIGGKVLGTSLSRTDEAKLQAALTAARS
jgi:uncharacterized membrane protein